MSETGQGDRHLTEPVPIRSVGGGAPVLMSSHNDNRARHAAPTLAVGVFTLLAPAAFFYGDTMHCGDCRYLGWFGLMAWCRHPEHTRQIKHWGRSCSEHVLYDVKPLPGHQLPHPEPVNLEESHGNDPLRQG